VQGFLLFLPMLGLILRFRLPQVSHAEPHQAVDDPGQLVCRGGDRLGCAQPRSLTAQISPPGRCGSASGSTPPAARYAPPGPGRAESGSISTFEGAGLEDDDGGGGASEQVGDDLTGRGEGEEPRHALASSGIEASDGLELAAAEGENRCGPGRKPRVGCVGAVSA
jgi:hypothetical protein